MEMRIGYACINTQLPSPARTVRLANASRERLRELVAENLDALEAILHWNRANGIHVFRISSDVVPFGSHPVNDLAWWDEFAERFARLAELLCESGTRASMHPGQYTVLSSERRDVVDASIADLEYHARLLAALGLDSTHKIVLHVGSSAPGAGARFGESVDRLSPDARSRLALENDERWPLAAVLEVAGDVSLPIAFDAFHHRLAPSFPRLGVRDVVLRVAESWSPADGRQEVHFSTQAGGRRPGAHAETLDLDAFARFFDAVGDLPLDCVLEVKDKEQSVLRARERVANGAAA
jgi:UV DNA damage endonuclease